MSTIQVTALRPSATLLPKLSRRHRYYSLPVALLALLAIAPQLQAQRQKPMRSPCWRVSEEDREGCWQKEWERTRERELQQFQKTPQGRAWLSAKQRLDAEGRDYSPSELLAALPADLQSAWRDEKQKVHDSCSAHEQYSSYNDCSCYANTVMDLRILSGPLVDLDALKFQAINKPECINPDGIVAYVYPKCTYNFSNDVKDIKGYCTCFANAMAKNYIKSPSLSIRNNIYLNKQSYGECNMADFGQLRP